MRIAPALVTVLNCMNNDSRWGRDITTETPPLGCPGERTEGSRMVEFVALRMPQGGHLDVTRLFPCVVLSTVLLPIPTAHMPTAPVPPSPTTITTAVCLCPARARRLIHRYIAVRHCVGICLRA